MVVRVSTNHLAGWGIHGPKPFGSRTNEIWRPHILSTKVRFHGHFQATRMFQNVFSETYWGINSSVPLYILVIFGLCMVRDPTFFARFSAFGTVTVILILFTAFYKVSFYIRYLINLIDS